MIRARFVWILFFFCFLAGTGRGWAAEARVEGKLTVHQRPAAGVKIMAHPVSARGLAEETARAAATAGEDGTFSLALAPGRYYILAQGQGLYAFYGRNPVTVPEEGLKGVNISLATLEVKPPVSVPKVATGVLGAVTFEGKPQAGTVIYVYTDLGSELKGMGLGMSAPTDEKGEFEFPLEAGTYYLVARHRSSGGFSGPLQAGDHFGYLPSNPLVIKDGEVSRVGIPLVEVPDKVDRLAGSLFGQTSIKGEVVDKEGHPAAGLHVLLYDNPGMLNRPLYVSQKTDADGHFVLSFPDGGVYFLSARDTLGGAPSAGELIGTYEGSPDRSLKVKTGEHKEGVRIVVQKMW